jgi:hypothetical protein
MTVPLENSGPAKLPVWLDPFREREKVGRELAWGTGGQEQVAPWCARAWVEPSSGRRVSV